MKPVCVRTCHTTHGSMVALFQMACFSSAHFLPQWSFVAMAHYVVWFQSVVMTLDSHFDIYLLKDAPLLDLIPLRLGYIPWCGDVSFSVRHDGVPDEDVLGKRITPVSITQLLLSLPRARHLTFSAPLEFQWPAAAKCGLLEISQSGPEYMHVCSLWKI